MRVRFSPHLAGQTGAAEGEVRLHQTMQSHRVMLILYTLFPDLLSTVAGRTNRDVIARELVLWCNGRPIGPGDRVRDEDTLVVASHEDVERGWSIDNTYG